MSTTNKSHKLFAYFVASLLALTGINANAAEAQPPGLLESFLCNFNDGQDMDDLLSARDYYLRQAEKAGITPEPAYVWTLFKGDLDFELVWHNVHANLAAFGASTDAGGAAPEMASVGERFNTVATCRSGIMAISPVFLGSDNDGPSEQAFVSAFGCNLRPGVGPDNISDLNGHISSVLGGLDTHKSFALFSGTPMTPGPTTPDLLYFGVSDNASAWANGVDAIGSSAGGPTLGRHFNATLDCAQSLWFSQQVVEGPAEE